jgi:hypothetical protein
VWVENAFWALVGIIFGFLTGLKTNYVIGRAFEYRAFLHHALLEVRLMPERLCSSSGDLNKVPRADAVVRLCADQIEYLGQRKVAETLRGIETQIAAKLEEAKHSAVDIDFHSEKVAWIRQLENLRPKWLVFLCCR